MSKHTPEPWTYYTEPQPNGCPIIGARGLMVAMLAHSVNHADQKAEAIGNADRIVSCVNACAGMSDPAEQIQGLYVARETLATVEAEREALRAERDALLDLVRYAKCCASVMRNTGYPNDEFEERISAALARSE